MMEQHRSNLNVTVLLTSLFFNGCFLLNKFYPTFQGYALTGLGLLLFLILALRGFWLLIRGEQWRRAANYILPLLISGLIYAIPIDHTTEPEYMVDNVSIYPPGSVTVLADAPDRHFASFLSLHPNNEDILFLEYFRDSEEVSKLFRYNLKTKQFRYYDLPKQFVTLDAAFSPSGKYIVMRRAPNVRGDANVKREAYASSQIVLMNADGTGFKSIPLSQGLKMAPVMSHDDQRIAYWRATQRPDHSKSFASKFDVWEYDLNTKVDKLFSGSFLFFGGGSLQYMKNDYQLLVNADIPLSDVMPGRTENNLATWMRERAKKYNNSSIYLMERGHAVLPEPLMTEVSYAENATMDANGKIYFTGSRPTVSFFCQCSIDKSLTQWYFPWKLLNAPRELQVSTDGKFIIFVPNNVRQIPEVKSRGVVIFYINKNTYSQIDIPKNELAQPILVKPLIN